ncbi:hypothetical protein RFI_04030 [Reticulomyxa filosa]|uniref:Uncharacterized protein n=1 Tax=Reticulomyxa filosa TaxID=46433 RepID=X6P4S2_RETFI|nr:hypothetical protein RFI_04030 [Reticulomyxa filosa]|eukprot:ETO33079.1 hypothetical protein RFI_04030 [Reticulomyxa filosa]
MLGSVQKEHGTSGNNPKKTALVNHLRIGVQKQRTMNKHFFCFCFCFVFFPMIFKKSQQRQILMCSILVCCLLFAVVFFLFFFFCSTAKKKPSTNCMFVKRNYLYQRNMGESSVNFKRKPNAKKGSIISLVSVVRFGIIFEMKKHAINTTFVTAHLKKIIKPNFLLFFCE